MYFFFFFSSRRRHTRFDCDWSSDVCSSDLCCPCCSPPQCPSDTFAVSGLPLAAHCHKVCDEVRNCHSQRRAPRESNPPPGSALSLPPAGSSFPFFRCSAACVQRSSCAGPRPQHGAAPATCGDATLSTCTHRSPIG